MKKRNGKAFTVIEIVIAVALFSIVFTVLWTFYSQSLRSQSTLTGGFSAQQDLMLAMERLSRELQEGSSIFFPAPNDPPRDGIGFVNAQGRAIMYNLEADPSGLPAKPGRLVRFDLGDKSSRIIARNVNYFRVSIQPPTPGKKVCLANLNLSLLRGNEDQAGKADDYCLLTKVFLRNLKKEDPE